MSFERMKHQPISNPRIDKVDAAVQQLRLELEPEVYDREVNALREMAVSTAWTSPQLAQAMNELLEDDTFRINPKQMDGWRAKQRRSA